MAINSGGRNNPNPDPSRARRVRKDQVPNKPFPTIPEIPGFKVGLYKVLEEKDDYLVCRGYDPLAKFPFTEGTPSAMHKIKVAKPPLLLKTPWDGSSAEIGGVTYEYSYTGTGVRTVTWTDGDGDHEEEERIDIPYFVGDIIVAVESQRSQIQRQGGMTVNDEKVRDEAGALLSWVDLNVSGRHWKRSDNISGVPGTSTTCPCGTTYARGSVSVTLNEGGPNEVVFEAAAEYTARVAIHGVTLTFTLAHTSGAVWESDVEELVACYGGSHSVKATWEFTGTASVAGVNVIEGLLTVVTEGTNACNEIADCNEGDDPCPTEDVDLKWACRTAHPLGTSTCESVDPQDPTDAVNDCVVCVSPVGGVNCGGVVVPQTIVIELAPELACPGGVHTWVFEKTDGCGEIYCCQWSHLIEGGLGEVHCAGIQCESGTQGPPYEFIAQPCVMSMESPQYDTLADAANALWQGVSFPGTDIFAVTGTVTMYGVV